MGMQVCEVALCLQNLRSDALPSRAQRGRQCTRKICCRQSSGRIGSADRTRGSRGGESQVGDGTTRLPRSPIARLQGAPGPSRLP
uniref:Uncharacterized protein n=1 Tax=Mesocestoides corti TaxID=53468 RepID=A0A5K3EVL9_MESCO